MEAGNFRRTILCARSPAILSFNPSFSFPRLLRANEIDLNLPITSKLLQESILRNRRNTALSASRCSAVPFLFRFFFFLSLSPSLSCFCAPYVLAQKARLSSSSTSYLRKFSSRCEAILHSSHAASIANARQWTVLGSG